MFTWLGWPALLDSMKSSVKDLMFYELLTEQIPVGIMHWGWGTLNYLEVGVGDNNGIDTYTYDEDKR